MLEKSHRRQLMSEVKKKQSLKKQLLSANEVIYSLENCLKVNQYFWCLFEYLLKEKEKQIQRLNIYSNRKQKFLKQSASTGNINSLGSDDFACKLGTKLNLLRKRKESFHVIEEKNGDLCDKCKEKEVYEIMKNTEGKNEINEEGKQLVKNDKQQMTSAEEGNNQMKSKEDLEYNKTEEIKIYKDQAEIDHSMSSIEEILEGKLSSPCSSLRSTKTLTPKEKVRLWLPKNSQTTWDSETNEIKVDFMLDKGSNTEKRDRFKMEKKDSQEEFENDSLNDEPIISIKKENLKESFETVINASLN